MPEVADRIAATLAREIGEAAQGGLRVFAVTSPLSLVAALAARALHAPRLAIATGFGVLDAIDPVPAVTLGEAALGVDGAVKGTAADTFVALAHQRLGVSVAPVQLDARGATNLSRIGGTDERPAVALPGSRGLPENNDAPAWVWYLVTDHRRLVERVDFASGPAPSPGRARCLLTPEGVFRLLVGGWRAHALTAGVTAGEVRERFGVPVDVPEAVATAPDPSPAERAALDAADPHGLRAVEVVSPDASREILERAAAAEALAQPRSSSRTTRR